jgi:hypothetical protein
MVLGILYQTFDVINSLSSLLFFLFNLTFGYIQIRRGFTVMGLVIVGTGIFLAALVIMD